MSVVDGSFGHPMKLEEEAAAGAEAYCRFGSGPQAEATAIMVSERLVETFRDRTKNEVNCTEITEINFQEIKGFAPILKYFVKGGKIGPGACFRLAAGYAQDAFNVINAALPEEPFEAPSPPVSCASVLAKKMGASEMHVVMASGFAGGISLSGGACGALAAAIWLTAMDGREEGASKIGYFNNPAYSAVIDRFVESTDCEFECCEIVGRKFESIDDHAAYLREGGCSEVIEALATQ